MSLNQYKEEMKECGGLLEQDFDENGNSKGVVRYVKFDEATAVLTRALSDMAGRVREALPEKKCKYDCEGDDGIGYHTKECDIDEVCGWNAARTAALEAIKDFGIDL